MLTLFSQTLNKWDGDLFQHDGQLLNLLGLFFVKSKFFAQEKIAITCVQTDNTDKSSYTELKKT